MASVLEPLLASSLAADCAASSFQSANTTEAPDSAKALAVARPNPDPAPVTSATLFSKDMFTTSSSLFERCILISCRAGPTWHSPAPSPSIASVRQLLSPRKPVLLVGDFFQPVHRSATQLLLKRDVRHGSRGRCAMPVLDASWNPNDIPLANHLNRAAPLLNPTDTP